MSTDPRTVVADYVAAVARGDADAIHQAFTEDVVWTYPGDLPLSGEWRGREAVVKGFLGSIGGLVAPGTAIEVALVDEPVVQGDRVVAEWTSRCTTVRGALYENRNLGVFTVRDGRIAAVREYTDTHRAATVLFANGE
ncbi:nuclear transport factor 2 family protein [Kitasatospora sp. NPDC001540]|uniref:nuclear transport factor 2 family protein n=1 Tax=Kitasatospora sp. NPDC001540 TaxID=3364014 RepID=UPI0036AE681C